MEGCPTFKKGDQVFAKMRGQQPWPAMILRRCGKKYHVKFYGIKQTGYIKLKDISYYLTNKERWDSLSKKEDFVEAIKEIEDAIAQLGTDGNANISIQAKDEPECKGESSEFSKPSASTQNCDSEDLDSNLDNKSTSEEGGRMASKEYSDSSGDCESTFEGNSAGACVPETHQHLPVLSEQELKNWVIYGNVAMAQPDLYKSQPVEERSHSEDQFLPVLLPSGKYVCLKLHKTWPLEDFDNEYECAIYDCDAASRILTQIDLVIKGEITPEAHPDLFIDNPTISAGEIKRNIYLKEFVKRSAKVNHIRTEFSLIEYERKVKRCLRLSKADAKKAIEYLNSMLTIEVEEITLKKHSHLVKFADILRKYVGNLEAWDLSSEQTEKFIEDAQIVREKATALFKKFKSALGLSTVTYFWEDFLEIVDIFQQDCEQLTTYEFYSLFAEPYSRASILERLESYQEIQDCQDPLPGPSSRSY